jgi:hypothetical protein
MIIYDNFFPILVISTLLAFGLYMLVNFYIFTLSYKEGEK